MTETNRPPQENKCHRCHSPMLATADKCWHCGESVNPHRPLRTQPMRTYEPMAGEEISKACAKICQMADLYNEEVSMSFNEIAIISKPQSVPGDLAQFYSEEMERRHQAYISSPEYKQQQAEWEEKDRKKKLLLEQSLAVAPPMSFKDEDGWKQGLANNTDPYGAAVYRYAEKWARLMQARNLIGQSVAECAKETSHIADDEGITGFMYGCAVNVLSHCWVHGEDLRRWHNIDTQIGNEGEKANESGGVLNPAAMTVG